MLHQTPARASCSCPQRISAPRASSRTAPSSRPSSCGMTRRREDSMCSSEKISSTLGEVVEGLELVRPLLC